MAKVKTLVYGFWDRFDDAVEQSNFTKAELARRIGCNRKTLYRGQHMPSPLFIARSAALIGVSTDYLLGIRGHE